MKRGEGRLHGSSPPRSPWASSDSITLHCLGALRRFRRPYTDGVSTQAPATSEATLQREWFRNALLALRRPRTVFRAMQDDSDEAASARQEPIVALIYLAGIAAVLSFSSTSRQLLDDPAVDGALVPILVFLGGGIYGFAGYWLGGLALHFGIRGAKGEGTYRNARHILGYALAPLALSLLVWPIRLAAFGSDNFKSGGSDEGAGFWAFTLVSLGFLVWSLALLAVGVREVHGWTVTRSIGAIVLTALALLGLGVLALVLSAG